MVQVVPVMQRARSASEVMQDRFEQAGADGVIDAFEFAELSPIVTLTVVLVGEASDCQTAGMAVIKGGARSERAASLLKQLEETYGYDLAR